MPKKAKNRAKRRVENEPNRPDETARRSMPPATHGLKPRQKAQKTTFTQKK